MLLVLAMDPLDPPNHRPSTPSPRLLDVLGNTLRATRITRLVIWLQLPFTWPNSPYCNSVGGDMSPGWYYGDLGWSLKGSCIGSNTPTAAPIRYTGNDNSAGGCQYQTCKDKMMTVLVLTMTAPTLVGKLPVARKQPMFVR